jgi:ubiquinone/menaquinone biosynthesis C-methylase UbiE
MEQEYVLGTHDEEADRLTLQHRAWRALVLSAWRRAGLQPGQTVIDVGCGPGCATMDLAAAVGPTGRVVAVDQSARFLQSVAAQARSRGFRHVETVKRDLSETGPPAVDAELAWCRWIFTFVRDPAGLVRRIHRALRPGGRAVVHEYFNYGTWRMMPRCRELEDFVAVVMDSWRAHGGEPDVAIDLPSWMADAGFAVESVRPHVIITTPLDQMWEWPTAFVYSGLERLVGIGTLSAAEGDRMREGFERAARHPGVRMVTPGVAEILAQKL